MVSDFHCSGCFFALQDKLFGLVLSSPVQVTVSYQGVVIRHSNADKHVLIHDDIMLCDVILKWAAAVSFG